MQHTYDITSAIAYIARTSYNSDTSYILNAHDLLVAHLLCVNTVLSFSSRCYRLFDVHFL